MYVCNFKFNAKNIESLRKQVFKRLKIKENEKEEFFFYVAEDKTFTPIGKSINIILKATFRVLLLVLDHLQSGQHLIWSCKRNRDIKAIVDEYGLSAFNYDMLNFLESKCDEAESSRSHTGCITTT